MMKEVSLDLATRLINHGPVVMVTSLYKGKADVTPVAWHMPVRKSPPVIALAIDENSRIFEGIMETGDFVVNIPSKLMAGKNIKPDSEYEYAITMYFDDEAALQEEFQRLVVGVSGVLMYCRRLPRPVERAKRARSDTEHRGLDKHGQAASRGGAVHQGRAAQ